MVCCAAGICISTHIYTYTMYMYIYICTRMHLYVCGGMFRVRIYVPELDTTPKYANAPIQIVSARLPGNQVTDAPPQKDEIVAELIEKSGPLPFWEV